jgi:hypothetical protein
VVLTSLSTGDFHDASGCYVAEFSLSLLSLPDDKLLCNAAARCCLDYQPDVHDK